MAEANRAQILSLAVAAIDAGGEAAIRVNHLAAAAGVTPPVIYYHFGSRDGLVVAAQAERYRINILRGLDPLIEGLRRSSTRDEYARVLLTVGYLAARTGEGRRLRIQALGSAITRPELQDAIRDAHRSSVDKLAEIFAFGQARGWVSTHYTAPTLAALWFGMITGHHVSEAYAQDADRESINLALVDAIALMLFGRTYPEFNNAEEAARAMEDYERVRATTPDPGVTPPAPAQ